MRNEFVTEACFQSHVTVKMFLTVRNMKELI